MSVEAQMPMDAVAESRDCLRLDSTVRREVQEDQFHLARLSIDDLSGLALAWRIRAQRGDKTTAAIAGALTSVARRRRAAAVARVRVLEAYRAWAPLRKLTEWVAARR